MKRIPQPCALIGSDRIDLILLSCSSSFNLALRRRLGFDPTTNQPGELVDLDRVSERCPITVVGHLNPLKQVRTSRTNISGCSKAAKCPPFSTSLK